LVTGEDIMSLYEIEEHIGVMIEEAALPTEADYSERSTSAEKWIQANSKKSTPPRADSKPNSKQAQKKYSHNKPSQHHKKHKDRPTEVKRDYKTTRRENTMHPAEQTKSVHTTTKPGMAPSTNADISPVKRNTEVVQSQDSKTKKSFFQRVLQRIFGK
jgi:hypothetical protein